jgi:hypothetical protein
LRSSCGNSSASGTIFSSSSTTPARKIASSAYSKSRSRVTA